MKKKAAQEKKEQLFFTIRDRIYSGYYWPREKLVETALAGEMGVSRTVIREVLKELAAKGLVTVEPHKGAFVAELSYENIKERVQLEAILEGAAAYMAAGRLTRRRIRPLQTLLEQAEEVAEPASWSDYNRRFHKIIITASANSRLIDIIRDNTGFLRYWFIQLSVPEEIAGRNKAHREILAALEDGNAALARALMEQHVLDSLSDLLERIKNSNPNLMKIDSKAGAEKKAPF